MKSILILFFSIFIFIGCGTKQIQKETPRKTYSFYDFDYSKEQINFFEKEFDNIYKINNHEILEKYSTFYEKHANYFLNGEMKVKKLKDKITKLKLKKNKTLEEFEKAKDKTTFEALKIYKKLAKEGNIKAQRILVNEYKIKNPEFALKVLENLVKEEDIESMKAYALANIYMVRPVIIQDYKKALKTYERLAQLGELSSIMRLGNFYEYGYHKNMVKKDKQKALEYYELAASKGYVKAKKKLFDIYSCMKCKPNRYNKQKADKLKDELLKEVNNKLAKVLTKKEEIKPLKKTKIKKIENKEIKKIEKKVEKPKKESPDKKEDFISFSSAKDKKLKLRQTVKCYKMETAKYLLTKECEAKIEKTLKNNKDLKRINILAVLDKSDKEYYKKELSNDKFIEPLLEALATKRSMETVFFLKNKLKDDSIINISTYNVTSKKQNKGVIVKFY